MTTARTATTITARRIPQNVGTKFMLSSGNKVLSNKNFSLPATTRTLSLPFWDGYLTRQLSSKSSITPTTTTKNAASSWTGPARDDSEVGAEKWKVIGTSGADDGSSTTTTVDANEKEKTGSRRVQEKLDDSSSRLNSMPHSPSLLSVENMSWKEAYSALTRTTMDEPTPEIVMYSFQLLDHMESLSRRQLAQVLQQQQQTQTPSSPSSESTENHESSMDAVIPSALIFDVLQNWRDVFQQQQEMKQKKRYKHKISTKQPLLLLPSQVYERFDRYRTTGCFGNFDLLSQNYSLVLDAAAHYKDGPRSEGVLFVDEMVRRLVDEYNEYYNAAPTNSPLPPHLVKPDKYLFGIAVHAWATSGMKNAPKVAEEWLAYMKRLQKMRHWRHLTIDDAVYNAAIQAWALIGNGERAEELLQEMFDNSERKGRRSSSQSKVRAFNIVLSAWAQRCAQAGTGSAIRVRRSPTKVDVEDSIQAAKRAETILMQMTKLGKSGKLGHGPDVVSYTTVIDCWTKCSLFYPEAPKRAHALLMQMKDDSLNFRPSGMAYGLVCTAYSRAGQPREAEAILWEAIQDYESNNNPNLKPDKRIFTSVIAAWSHANGINFRDAAEAAEALLRRMEKLYESGRFGEEIRPGLESYSAVISCWAKVASLEGATRAETLFRELKEKYAKTNTSLQMDVVMYSTLMHAWGKAGRPIRAESLLDEMLLEYFEKGNQNLKPNSRTFSTALSAWSRAAPSARNAERAEALLGRMRELHESNRLDTCKPDTIAYSAVLNCWAVLGTRSAAERAQALFEDMRNSNDPDVHPNVITYSTLMKAYTNAGMAERANDLLMEMIQRHENGDHSIKPNAFAFVKVIWTWCNSKHWDAAERAEAMIMVMNRLYRSGVLDRPADIELYDNVLRCWSVKGTLEAAKRAESLLHHHIKAEHVQPSQNTYNHVVRAWTNTIELRPLETHELVAALDSIEILVSEMITLSKEQQDPMLAPNQITYDMVQKALLRTKEHDIPNKAAREEMLLKLLKGQTT